MRKLVITFAVMLCWVTINAQKNSISLFIGNSIYKGDLSSANGISSEDISGSIGLQCEHLINGQWGLRGSLLASNLSGDDSRYEERSNYNQLNFRSTLFEVMVGMNWYFLEGRMSNQRKDTKGLQKLTFTPYFYSGIGVTTVDARVNGLPSDAPEVLEGRDEGTYLSIPIGVGSKFYLTESWIAGFEAGFRLPTTDFLDGISDSRNPGKKDFQMSFGLYVGYLFNKKKKEKEATE